MDIKDTKENIFKIFFKTFVFLGVLSFFLGG